MPAKKIALCIPLFNSVPPEVVMNLTNFLYSNPSNPKYSLKPFFTLDLPISYARDLLVKSFLESDCDYLFFVDSDMLLPKDILDKLLAHNKDIVSGMAFDRTKGFPVIKKAVKDGLEPFFDYPENKLIEVGATGSACLLIKRKVIEKLCKKESNKPLFAVQFLNRVAVRGVDVYFCLLARKHGFKVFVDTGLIVGHFGGAVIGGFGEKLDKLGIEWGSLNA